MSKTFFPTKKQALESRRWLLIDAKGLTLGRLATRVASLVRGKHKVSFSPHVDCGDFVVVVNASQVKLTGNKLESKFYRYHTGYIGGIKEIRAGDQIRKNSPRMITHAVKGMLPNGPLGFSIIKKLKVYAGETHPHKTQKFESVQIN